MCFTGEKVGVNVANISGQHQDVASTGVLKTGYFYFQFFHVRIPPQEASLMEVLQWLIQAAEAVGLKKTPDCGWLI